MPSVDPKQVERVWSRVAQSIPQSEAPSPARLCGDAAETLSLLHILSKKLPRNSCVQEVLSRQYRTYRTLRALCRLSGQTPPQPFPVHAPDGLCELVCLLYRRCSDAAMQYTLLCGSFPLLHATAASQKESCRMLFRLLRNYA